MCLKLHPDARKDVKTGCKPRERIRQDLGNREVLGSLGLGSSLGPGPGGVLNRGLERTDCTVDPCCVAGTVQSSLLI